MGPTTFIRYLCFMQQVDLTVMGTRFSNNLFLLSLAILSEELINTKGDT